MADVGLRRRSAPSGVRTARNRSSRRLQAFRPSLLSLATGAVVLALTAGLTITVDVVNNANEDRLLRLQTRQTATLLQSVIQNFATPLASAAEIAAGTGGNSSSFQRYVTGFMTTQTRFTSLTLWSVTRGDVRLVSTVGRTPELGTSGVRATSFVRRAATAGQISINGLLIGPTTQFGYGYGSSRGPTRYVVYVESALRQRLRTKVGATSPFHDLRFALYLGRGAAPRNLLLTSESTPTVHGRTAQAVVPFGATSLTVVAGPRGSLGGQFADQRWWIVLALGSAVALGAGLLTDRLVKRRRRAEALTAEIDGLLRDQRGIAESLQRALVPDGLPVVAGLDLGARYLPGVNGVEIGGDWYDVVPVGGHRVFFAIGDVSGRGIEAGSVMASLHFAIRAYATEGHDPATVLDLLGGLLITTRDRHFATVVCGLADLDTGTVTVANAGHLPMLVVDGPRSRFLDAPVGPPIGVRRGSRYRSTTVELPLGATLLAYTDGLVERRGEVLDDGLARLRAAAAHLEAPVEDLLTSILAVLAPDGSDDDTAILALRRTTDSRTTEPRTTEPRGSRP